MSSYAAPVVASCLRGTPVDQIATTYPAPLVFVPGEVGPPRGGDWTVTVTGGTVEAPWRWLCARGTGEPSATTHVVAVDAPGAEQAGPFAGLGVAALRAVLRELESLLGVPWGASTGVTAERLILSTHPRERGGVLLDREPHCPPAVAGSTLEMPYTNWTRPLTGVERAAEFVHTFDANAQYLGAWQSVELGFGEVEHLADAPVFDPALVGFWRLEARELARLSLFAVPLAGMRPAPWLAEREWFSTATLRRVVEGCGGMQVYPAEAYVWPRKTRFLREAGRRLRDAREVALEHMDEADGFGAAGAWDIWRAVLAAVKDCYRIETGRFGWEGHAGSPWYRPDWGHEVRATARCNLHRRVSKLTAAPFAIATDALAFATDQPDAALFAESIGLPLHAGLGGFRHEGSCLRGELDLPAGAPGIMRRVAALQHG